MPVHHLRESLLPKLSLRRPVTVVMAFIAVLIVGYIASSRIPLSLLPGGYEENWIGLWISYRGASPTEVEQQIARPVEGILRTLGGVEDINTSSSHGGCWTFVRFRTSVDMTEAYNRFRDRIDRIRAILPEDVNYIRVVRRGNDDMPILWIGLPVDREYTDLHGLVEEQIVKPLERIDGVARVEIEDINPASAEIEIIQERVISHGVNVYQLVQQLRRDNFSISSGYIKDGTEKLFIRSDSRFTSLSEIGELTIEGHPGLRIQDVAVVTYGAREHYREQRIDGERAVSIAVYKESLGNTVAVTQAVVSMLEDDLMQRPQLEGFSLRIMFDQGANILRSLGQLRSTGLWGGLFAVFILFFFLRRVRMTFVITGAIPLSVLVSLGTMYFMGWSLNVVTMMGLIIGVGMVVDNSIVVVEAIYARRVAGENTYKAALHGASEVGLAITVSTLTTIVVFLPLIFMSGDRDLSFYMGRIGMPVVYALVGSLGVALLFIPLVTSRLMSGRQPATPQVITAAGSVYQRILTWVMVHRLESVVLTFVTFASIAIPAGEMASSLDANGRFTPMIHVRFDMPDHYDQATSDQIVAAYEKYLNENRDRYGIKMISTAYWWGAGRLRAFLQQDERPWYAIAYHDIMATIGYPVYVRLSKDDVVADFRDNSPRFAGVKLNIDRSGQDEKRTSVTLFGDDTQTLVQYAAEVERRLRLLPGIDEVNSDMEDGEQELRLQIDRERAQRYGLNGNTVASTLSYALRGMPLRAYRTESREVDLRIRLREDDRQNLDQVLNMTVAGNGDDRVPIGNVVTVEVGRGLDRIRRLNGRTRVVVTAISRQKDLQNLAGQIRNALAGFELPRGYQWTLSGRFEEMDEERNDSWLAVLLAVAFVFLLMGILFESFILPLSVIIAIPFSFLGVYWMLWITNTPFELMASIGTIVLIGVVVNNAIVLVDLVNRLRAEGYERVEAILEAGRNRFRPILMTSATTIFGLLPMALGNGDLAGIPHAALGRAMIGGLITSTALTLIVVPLFYTLFDDLRVSGQNLVALIWSRHVKPDEVRVTG
jgi:hydrophobic/amphiphilic exporter-1 (mainly G- bacteria), HAE1 family